MKGECPKGFVPSSYVYVLEGGLIVANLMVLMSAISRYDLVLSNLQYYFFHCFTVHFSIQ